MWACVGTGVVDVCLIPEVPFAMEKLVDYVRKIVDTKGHCVICVAEGAGQDMVSVNPLRSLRHLFFSIAPVSVDRTRPFQLNKGLSIVHGSFDLALWLTFGIDSPSIVFPSAFFILLYKFVVIHRILLTYLKFGMQREI